MTKSQQNMTKQNCYRLISEEVALTGEVGAKCVEYMVRGKLTIRDLDRAVMDGYRMRASMMIK